MIIRRSSRRFRPVLDTLGSRIAPSTFVAPMADSSMSCDYITITSEQILGSESTTTKDTTLETIYAPPRIAGSDPCVTFDPLAGSTSSSSASDPNLGAMPDPSIQDPIVSSPEAI